MKNKKSMIIILVIIIILVMILSVFSLIIKKQNDKKQSNNMASNNNYNISKENENMNVNNDVDNNSINNAIANQNSVGNNTTKVNPVILSPKEAFVRCLSDQTWIKDNLYLKTDCFNKTIDNNEKQTVKFIKINEENWSAPVVLVYTECDSRQSNQCYILTYKDGNIEVKSMDDRASSKSHTSYKVNKSDKIIFKESQYSEGEYYDIYSITEEGIQNICSIKRNNQVVDTNMVYKYYYNDKEINENQYNSIMNQYIKKFVKKEDFILLNQKNIQNEF